VLSALRILQHNCVPISHFSPRATFSTTCSISHKRNPPWGRYPNNICVNYGFWSFSIGSFPVPPCFISLSGITLPRQRLSMYQRWHKSKVSHLYKNIWLYNSCWQYQVKCKIIKFIICHAGSNCVRWSIILASHLFTNWMKDYFYFSFISVSLRMFP
jgi:hypothetical protein